MWSNAYLQVAPDQVPDFEGVDASARAAVRHQPQLADLSPPLSEKAGQDLLKMVKEMAPREVTVTSLAQELDQVVMIVPK